MKIKDPYRELIATVLKVMGDVARAGARRR